MIPTVLIMALFLSVSQAIALHARFCTPLPLPAPEQKIKHIKSGDVSALLQKLRLASPDTTLLLAGGVYTLSSDQSLEVNTPRITIRGVSGDRDAVVIRGGYNNISVNADDCIIADVMLRNPRFHNIQVRGEKGISRTKVYNVHLLDAGQQFIKVSTGDGTKGRFADDGLIACSLIEYTTYAHGTEITPPHYTNGVDILAGRGWVIRDNVFRRIRSRDGPAGPAILVWKNALNTLIKRNLIIDSWRGIVLGLNPPDKSSRGGSHVIYDHQNGLVEHNVILALNEPADAAIENNYAFNSLVLHNTVYYNEDLKHAVDWAIEYRFPPTTAVIKNNSTNLPIIKRHPYPRQEAIVAGNITSAKTSWFRDIAAGDVHHTGNALGNDYPGSLSESSEDIDGNQRPSGRASEPGADEFASPSSDKSVFPLMSPRQTRGHYVHFVSPAPVTSPGNAGLQPGSRSHAGAWRSQRKPARTGSGFMKQTSPAGPPGASH